MRRAPWRELFVWVGLAMPCLGETGVDAARAHRAAHGARIVTEFAELLSIPNFGGDPANLHRNAEWIRTALERRGVASKLLTLPGAPPIVFGRMDVAGAERTLAFYVHYDGQPVDPKNWTDSPWSPTLYTAAIEAGGVRRSLPKPGAPIDPEWRLYARSAGDDKAPVIAMLAALEALAKRDIKPTSNLVFIFEGEEESGSTHLGQYLKRHRAELDPDAWIICDGPAHQSRRPQLVFGVRGVTGFDITVYGAVRHLHSGHYGNWAPNPALMLADLLAGMKDQSGRVRIKGFYDSVDPLGAAERAALATIPEYDDALRRELGLVETEAGDAPLAERLLLPSLNVRGFASGGVGKLARNVIPASATASIDIRLVKGNEPAAMLGLVETHIKGEGYHLVREDPDMATRLEHPRIAKVVGRGGYPAARTSMDAPLVGALVAASEQAAGKPMILVPSLGGSLPLYLFRTDPEIPVVVAPIANHDNNQHGPDENLRIGNLWYGIDLMAALFTMPR